MINIYINNKININVKVVLCLCKKNLKIALKFIFLIHEKLLLHKNYHISSSSNIFDIFFHIDLPS